MTEYVTLSERVPDRGETIESTHFSTHHGGKGANSAVAAYRLSHANPNGSGRAVVMEDEIQVHMIGAVGADEFGPPLKAKVAESGVNTDGIRVVEGQPTGVGVALVETESETETESRGESRKSRGESRGLYRPGANHKLCPSDFMTLESLAGGVKPDLVIAQQELRRKTIEQVIETASREGIDVLLNPTPASYLKPKVYGKVKHLVLNETEAVSLSPRDLSPVGVDGQVDCAIIADYFLKLGVKNVVVTLGAQGAYYKNESGDGYVEAEKECTVLDTTGAGYVLTHASPSIS